MIGMRIDWVRLELDVTSFDPTGFTEVTANVAASGITLVTFAELGDTATNQRALYELNAECSADIPGRAPFFTWPEFQEHGLDVPRSTHTES